MKFSIARWFFISFVIMAIISVFLFGFWEVRHLHRDYRQEVEKIRSRYVEEQKNIIKQEVNKIVSEVEFEKSLYERYLTTTKISLAALQQEILERIGRIRFGREGYIFVVSYDGVTLMNDTQRYLIGIDIWDMEDPNGVKVIQAERRAVENPAGDFIYYVWNKPSASAPSPKVSFLKGVPGWQWMIGAGVYLDDVEQELREINEDLKVKVRNHLRKFLINIIFFIGLLVLIAKIMSHRIKKEIQTFLNVFSQPVPSEQMIDPDRLSFSELKILAVKTNEMLTRQRQNRAILEEKELLLRTIIDTHPHFIFIKDKNGRYLLANQAVADNYGVTTAELIGKTDADLAVSKQEAEFFRADDLKILSGKTEKLVLDEIITDKKGNIKNLLTIKIPFKIKENAETAVLGVSIDITDLKKTQLELERKNAELRREIRSRIKAEVNLEDAQAQIKHIIDNSTNVFYAHTSRHQVTYISPQIETVLGYTPREALVVWTELMSDNPVNLAGLEKTNKAITTRQPQGTYELELLHKNGSKVWVEVREVPVVVEDSVIMVGSLTDITDRKAALEKLNKYQQKLEQMVEEKTVNYEKSQQALHYLLEDMSDARMELEKLNLQYEILNKELEAFSYSISHDLKAPLRAIDNFSVILAETMGEKMDKDAREYLGFIRENINKMEALILGLMEFSRVSRRDLNLNKVDMNKLLRDVTEEIKMAEKGRNIEFIISDLPKIRADQTMMRQVLINLVSNAVKYSRIREVTRIECGWRKREKDTVIQIRDNGIGFDMRYKNKLFGVFQKLHPPEEYEGSGVGLAIVQRLVAKHGGMVWAEAEPDKGATFYFSIPD